MATRRSLDLESSGHATTEQPPLLPFLRWAGGKRWLVQNYSQLIPQKFERYIEPFLGGGSMFFHLRPSKAILGDANESLVDCYRGVQGNWSAVQASLRYRQIRHNADPDYYYLVRDRTPRSLTERASRFIYLNRTCYNGLYRVNSEGVFNVPKGSRDAFSDGADNLRRASAALRSAALKFADFEDLIRLGRTGDLIFADPPYTVQHDLNGFLKYNEVLFSWSDQERLAAALAAAVERGATVIGTSANHQSVRALYEDYGFSLRRLSRVSALGGKGARRGSFKELLFTATSKRKA